jgi:DNA ligase-1
VRPKGTIEDRRDIFKKAQSYVGKKLTVKYQELTDDGIPRFPIGLAIRDYE